MSTSGWVEGRLGAVMEDLAEGRLVLKQRDHPIGGHQAGGGRAHWLTSPDWLQHQPSGSSWPHPWKHTHFSACLGLIWAHIRDPTDSSYDRRICDFVWVSPWIKGCCCSMKSPLIIREQVIISALTFLDEQILFYRLLYAVKHFIILFIY